MHTQSHTDGKHFVFIDISFPIHLWVYFVQGDRDLWVSLAFTVLRMDAGRIVQQKRLQLGPDETSDVALAKLFELGGQMLVENLPNLLGGGAYVVCPFYSLCLSLSLSPPPIRSKK